jgi:hypothetical protein
MRKLQIDSRAAAIEAVAQLRSRAGETVNGLAPAA